MVDTGRTMTKLVATLMQYKPAKLRNASLFVKRTPLSNGFRPECLNTVTLLINISCHVQTLASKCRTSSLLGTPLTTTSTSATSTLVVTITQCITYHTPPLQHIALLNDLGKVKYAEAEHKNH